MLRLASNPNPDSKTETSLLHIRKRTYTHSPTPDATKTPPTTPRNSTKRKKKKTTSQKRQRTSQNDTDDSKRLYRQFRILPRDTDSAGNVMSAACVPGTWETEGNRRPLNLKTRNRQARNVAIRNARRRDRYKVNPTTEGTCTYATTAGVHHRLGSLTTRTTLPSRLRTRRVILKHQHVMPTRPLNAGLQSRKSSNRDRPSVL